MKSATLCVALTDLLAHSEINPQVAGIYPAELGNVPADAFHFINRKVVDTKETSGLNHEIAQAFPQLLVYATVQDENGAYLSYSRGSTGGESRLANQRSIGVGGHTDISDVVLDDSLEFIDVPNTLRASAIRELYEETMLRVSLQLPETVQLISNMSDPASAVHMGVWINIKVLREQVVESSETQNLQWLQPKELAQDIDIYEPWSRLIINQLGPTN